MLGSKELVFELHTKKCGYIKLPFEKYALLGDYTAGSDNLLPTFRDNLRNVGNPEDGTAIL
jgi:hypothetical protein